MNRLLAALVVAATLAAAVPTAQAQAPTGLTLACDPLAEPVPYAGASSLSCTAVVGCLEMLTNQGATTATITAQSPPTWLTVGAAEATFNPQDCVTGSGSASAMATVPITVAPEAPGVVEHTVDLAASLGSTSSEPAQATFTVAYDWNYTVVPDISFPYTMTEPSVTFNLTVTQASNARSMVMMEEQQTSAGHMTGLASTVYENEAGAPVSKVFTITYTAPTGEWDNATASFTAYGHYLLLDSRAGEYDDGTHVTWAFTNGGIEPEGGDGGDKDAPAPAGALLALGLVALAAVLRRRA